MISRQKVVLISAILVMAILVGGCTTGSEPESVRITLKSAIPSDPGTLNPVLAKSTAELQVSRIIFDGLTKLDHKSFEPKPGLARNWTLSSDNLKWTFELRDDVRWHDGEPFTAEDVKFSFDLMMDPQVNCYNRSVFRNVKDAVVVDQHKIEFILDVPFVSLPVMVANCFGIVPKHLLEGKDVNTYSEFNKKNPIGTGPFKLAEYKSGEYFHLVKNEDYYFAKVKADEVYLKIVPDINTQIAQLNSGELDLIPFDVANLPAVAESSDINLVKGIYPRWHAFHLNCNHPLFQDVRVRQAISYAIDREAIIENVLMGFGSVATGPIIPAIEWAYNTNVTQYPLDLEKAKDLLAEAGWEDHDGDGILDKTGEPFRFEISVVGGSSVDEKASTIIHQNLKAIGMDPSMKQYELSAWVEEVRDTREGPNMFHSYFSWMTPEAEPDGIYKYFYSTPLNHTGYKNEEVDQLLDTGRSNGDREVRHQAYMRVQEILAEECARIFLAYPHEVWAVRQGVQGVYPGQPYVHSYDWTIEK